MDACRSEGGRAIVMLLRGEACGVTECRPGAFDGLGVRDANARRENVSEQMRVEGATERALRQFGDDDVDRVFGKRRSRSAEPQAIAAGSVIEVRTYVRQVMVEEPSGVGRNEGGVRAACLGLAAVDIDPPDAGPPLHVAR